MPRFRTVIASLVLAGLAYAVPSIRHLEGADRLFVAESRLPGFGPRLLDRKRVVEQPLALSRTVTMAASLNLVPAHAVNRLRSQPDMTHHRDVDRRDAPNRISDRAATFELDRFRAAFLDQATGVAPEGPPPATFRRSTRGPDRCPFCNFQTSGRDATYG